MSKRSLCLAIGISALVGCTPATAQEIAPVTPVIELVGTSEIKEANAVKKLRWDVGEWRPADPLASRGLVISIRAIFPTDVTADFRPPAVTLSYSTNGTWHTASCLGVSFPDVNEKGQTWYLTQSDGVVYSGIGSAWHTITAGFLFEVPPNISDVSFIYRGRVVLKELPLPWK